MYPKPVYKKSKNVKYPPLFDLGFCWGCLCEYGLERHHIYGGNPDRKHSEDFGLYVDLCHKCHLNVTDEKDKELSIKLKQEGQRRFESIHGHDKFMLVFRRNYL